MVFAKLILAAAAVLLALYFLMNRRKARAKAGVKVGFFLFVAFALYAVARPDDITWIANQVGIGRGTDLLLYILFVAFAFVTVSTYLRLREQELRYARLARAVALRAAEQPRDDTTPPPASG